MMTPATDGGMTEGEAKEYLRLCAGFCEETNCPIKEHYTARGLLRGLALGRVEKEQLFDSMTKSLDGLISDHEKDAATIAALEKRNAELISTLEKAFKELNEIRARDGVPYTHYGVKACVDENYFSSVVDEISEALAKHKSEGMLKIKIDPNLKPGEWYLKKEKP